MMLCTYHFSVNEGWKLRTTVNKMCLLQNFSIESVIHFSKSIEGDESKVIAALIAVVNGAVDEN